MSVSSDHCRLLQRRAGGTRILLKIGALMLGLTLALAANAAGFGAYKADVKPADVFPGADRFGPFAGSPVAAPAYRDGKVAGYVFETTDIGYSGKPIRILVGLDQNGVIVGAKVIEHHEPILLVGIPQEELFDFVTRHVGRNVVQLSQEQTGQGVDVISGATVTAIVINDGLSRQALAVARSRGLAGFGVAEADKSGSVEATASVLADVPYEPADWAALADEGLVRRLHLSNAEVDAAFLKAGTTNPATYVKQGPPDELFIDLYLALASVESVGRSLLPERAYLAATSEPGSAAIVVAANGNYSFRGSGFVRGGIFDRIQLVQDGTTILFKDKDYKRLDHFAAPGSPAFAEIGLFRIPAAATFDPAKPFRLDLLVQRPLGPIEKAFTSFSLPYQLPARFLRTVPAQATTQAKPVEASPTAPKTGAEASVQANAAPQSATWLRIWRSRALDVAIMSLSLTILMLIFFFQDWLVKHPVLFNRLRTGFMLFSVLWLGLYAKAQLSVINIFTFTNAIMTDFRWDFFLLEPLIFLLWCATAVSLLFWGRGAYCGWLCPFGSLQELLNEGARRLGIRQITVPYAWHERLSALKYVLFLALFGVALGNMALAEQLAEIEPFKTVVLLRFMREWPFVVFALALLTAGLFIERFYCRYLCVLGAGLAVPGRGRMFDWLKRRKQCGYECQLCAKKCRVQAINPLGKISPNECLYCMQCQVIYWDDHVCPPLIMKREGRGKKSAPPPRPLAPPAEIKRAHGLLGTTTNTREKLHVEA